MRWAAVVWSAAALTAAGCAHHYDRTYLGTVVGGFRIAGFREIGPPSSGPSRSGVRNNEPVAMCVAWINARGARSPYFRVEPWQELYHPRRGVYLAGVWVSDDLSIC